METVDWRQRKLRFQQSEKTLQSRACVSGNRCNSYPWTLRWRKIDSVQYEGTHCSTWPMVQRNNISESKESADFSWWKKPEKWRPSQDSLNRSERSERENFSEVIMFNVSNPCFLRLFWIHKEILIYAQKNHFIPGLKRDNDATRLSLMCWPRVSFKKIDVPVSLGYYKNLLRKLKFKELRASSGLCKKLLEQTRNVLPP